MFICSTYNHSGGQKLGFYDCGKGKVYKAHSNALNQNQNQLDSLNSLSHKMRINANDNVYVFVGDKNQNNKW